MVTDDRILSVLDLGLAPYESVRTLLNLALQAGSKDNVTIVLVCG